MINYSISITTESPSALAQIVQALSKLDCRFSASDSDPVTPSAPAVSAPASAKEAIPSQDRISEIASLAVPPGLPAELSKATPAKVKDLKEFLLKYCSVDASCHTIPQEILKALASVIDDKSHLLNYLRDDGKPNKEFKQAFNVWKKSLNIIQNGQKETWLGTRSTTQTSYPIRIDIGGKDQC